MADTRPQPHQLDGRVALVTGASRGIGREIALELARQGCWVVLSSRTATPREGVIGSLQATQRQIESEGGVAMAVEADLMQDADIARLHEEATSAWGRVDILVNNAAVMEYYVPLAQADVQRLDAEFAVNLRAPFLLTQLFAPAMAAQGRGVIINLSSRTADIPDPPQPAAERRPGWASVTYGASKAALNRLGVSLAHELFEAKVAVVTLCPGFTVTERMAADPPPGVDPARAESADGVTAAVVRVCLDPMGYTGRILSWHEVMNGPANSTVSRSPITL